MSKENIKTSVNINVEKITFEGKTFEEIKAIAKANNEARRKAYEKSEKK